MGAAMTPRERILATLDGRPVDHVPLNTWCFGFPAPPGGVAGEPVRYWYSKRLEHIHTLPQPWELADEFARARAWRAWGVDDLLEVSVPWSQDPAVMVRDRDLPSGMADGDPRFPVRVREYTTPAGLVRHVVQQTGAEPSGWPMQPPIVPLFEDYNIPRAVRHPVTKPAEVAAIRHLFAPPDAVARQWFAGRVAQMKSVADAEGFPIQAWSAFGMDAAVWLTGTEGAIMLAMDAPEAFRELIEIIAATDYARTELAVQTPGVDIVCQRGWYSSLDFWSPALFEEYVVPHLRDLASLAHRHGRKFGYVMTTGVEQLGPRLADAGVDLLYFVDPLQDRFPLKKARELLGGRMTLVGGINTLSLASGDRDRIRREVHRAIEILAPTHRFILHPVDALFPDTPWSGVEMMIEAWKEATS